MISMLETPLILADQLFHRLPCPGASQARHGFSAFAASFPCGGQDIICKWRPLNRRPVNFVPLTTSVKVLFSTSSLHRSSPPFCGFCRGAFDTKAGPPTAVKGNGSSYHHQNAVPQLGQNTA